MTLPPPTSPLFPYTTLFRSATPTFLAPGISRFARCPADSFHWLSVSAKLKNPAAMFSAALDLRNGATREEKLPRSEEHTSELQSLRHLVCRLLLEKKKNKRQ